MRKLIAAAMVVMLAGFLNACSTSSGPGLDPVELAVKVGTMRYIEKHPRRAQRVADAARKLKPLVAGDLEVSIADLREAAYKHIEFNQLPPSEQFLAEELVAMIAQVLTERIGEGILSPDSQVKVRRLLDWAARMGSTVAAEIGSI